MSSIQDMLEVLTPKQQKEFHHFLEQRNTRKSIKNLALLKLVASGKTKDMSHKLYGATQNTAFNALHKRVKDALVGFVATKAFEQESLEEMEILKLLLASRIFFEQGVLKVAINTLEKAERRAQDIDGHTILNEIYQTKIQYAHLSPSWHLDKIIKAQEANSIRHQKDKNLNIAYAQIRVKMKQQGAKNINAIIKDTFTSLSLEVSSDLTFKSLYQLMVITASAAKLQNDYYSISPYMIQIFETLRAKGDVPKKYSFYYLHMLYLMATTHFRNKRFEQSLQTLSVLKNALRERQKKYQASFKEKVLVLETLIATYTGHLQKAIPLLADEKRLLLNGQLVRIMCLFLKTDFKEAYYHFKHLNRSDRWYEQKMGWLGY
ncbi:MAG: hypothetical protein AAGF77_14880 [Bacteroidota bacterium]